MRDMLEMGYAGSQAWSEGLTIQVIMTIEIASWEKCAQSRDV